jgi:SMP-30/Gluconolactonase/LRE-like region
MVPLDNGTVILASSLNNGGLYVINAKSHAVTKLEVTRIGERPLAMYRCASLRDSGVFVSHGLSVKPAADGHFRLYVVRHGGRETIEIFEFAHAQDFKSLLWLGCVSLPHHFSGNAVVGRRDGGFFTTSMTDPNGTPPSVRLATLFAAKPAGAVLEWTPGSGSKYVDIGSISGPNGIELSPDDKTLYVDAWASRAIWEFALRDKAYPERHVDVPFLPDNLRWGDDGRLFSAGMFSTPRALLTCAMKTAVGVICGTHWGAVAIDPATMDVSCRIEQHDYLDIGDVSTVLKIGGALWLASFDNIVAGIEPISAWCPVK